MSAEQRLKKIEEANALMKEANKLSTKTLFRWKCDYDGAGLMFEKAATNYKNCQLWELAKDAFKKGANCQVQSEIPFAAAKSYDNAAQMAKEMGDLKESVDLARKAVPLYCEAGSQEKGAEVLTRVAKWNEDSDPETSIQLMKEALDIFETEQKEHLAANTFKYAVALVLKNKKYEEAIEIYKKQVDVHARTGHEPDLFKAYLSLVVLYLLRDDYVAADALYQDASLTSGFMNSKEGRAASGLLDAFNKRDNDALKAVVSQQVFDFIDNEVAKIARKFKVTGLPANTEDDDPTSLA